MKKEKTDTNFIDELINKYSLHPHPEGGYYKETYRSEDVAEKLPGRFKGPRNYSTAIYYLLDYTSYSKFHRIKSDEMWHFYEGSGLYIHELTVEGAYVCHKLGKDTSDDYSFQVLIKNGSWFSAENIEKSSYSLVGCTVSPGFDFNDFEIADTNQLITLYPDQRKLIERLL